MELPDVFGQTPVANTVNPTVIGTVAADLAIEVDNDFPWPDSRFGGSGPTGRVAIMLVGYGSGKRGTPATNDRWNAPGLAEPPTNLNNRFTSLLANDWTLAPDSIPFGTSTIGGQPWTTPWFDQGPKTCAAWLGAFAIAYSNRIASQIPDTSRHPLFQPARLVFDFEDPNGGTLHWVDQIGLPFTVGLQFNQNEGRVDGPAAPTIKGINNALHQFPASWNGNKTLFQLYDDAIASGQAFPIGGTFPQREANWLWYNNLLTQAQNAAFARSVNLEDALPSDPANPTAAELFTLSAQRPRFTNFSWSTSDYVVDANTPPYTWAGAPVRRFSYRQGNDVPGQLFNFSYQNFCDFNAPVSYGWGVNVGQYLAPGQSKSAYTLQQFRELVESTLFSNPLGPLPIGTPRPRDFITPWVAAINTVIVNADHHRKLLALARAKRCVEFNIFHPQLSTLNSVQICSTKYRRLVEQVFGFDWDGLSSLTHFGNLQSFSNTSLNFGDAEYLSLQSIANSQGGPQLPFPHMVSASTTFTLRGSGEPIPSSSPEGQSRPAAVYLDASNSDNIRVNLEFNVRFPDLPAAGPDPDPAVWQSVIDRVSWLVYLTQTINGVQSSVAVPMTLVNTPGYSPTFGFRYVATGQLPNPNRRLVSTIQNPSQPLEIGRVSAQLVLGSGWPFTAYIDLVQIVGADNDNLDLDWNHDNVVNKNDLFAYLNDFELVYRVQGHSQTIYTGNEISGLDINENGNIAPSDCCAFYTKLLSMGVLTPQDCQQFVNFLRSHINMDCTPTLPTDNCRPAESGGGGGAD
ncbi:MAG: hypothetical protein K2W85_16160 [Phycisphaerales bacterium]|nr:hypothetical protein [Phycisphaerales bacterium]